MFPRGCIGSTNAVAFVGQQIGFYKVNFYEQGCQNIVTASYTAIETEIFMERNLNLIVTGVISSCNSLNKSEKGDELTATLMEKSDSI